jgi:uncharacterized protein YbaP (TraB family)
MNSVIDRALSGLKEKELKMIWEISRDGKISVLVGTAHFFPYSFRRSITEYIGKVDTVLIEGPLDEDAMAKVAKAGRQDEMDQSLRSFIDHETEGKLIAELSAPFKCRSTFFRYYGHVMENEARDSLDEMFNELKPWLAFFSIWYQYLRMRGWAYSMDKDAYHEARELNKHVHYLEEIDEQINALEHIPVERIVNFLSNVSKWKDYMKRYVRIFLRGDLEKLMANAEVFPTRCEAVIENRDIILYERMKPYIDEGNCMICVGITHIMGIKSMLRKDGWSIKQLR